MRLVKGNMQLSASDLVNYLGCKHLTELDRKVALGLADKPDWNDPALAILYKKGLEHEAAYVQHLKESGLSLIDLTDQPYNAVEQALAKGYDIITQATFQRGQWMGRADILRKVAGKSKFGEYAYEVEDTKLAQVTKAGTVLQLCLYTDLLSGLQETTPHQMHVVKPGESFPKESFFFSNFKSYYALIKRQFEQVISNDPESTYPLPVSKCDICRWWKHCDKQWHKDDHLSLIAGLRNLHFKELESQNFSTLEQYALEDQPLRKRPQKGNPETYKKLHGQAKIQFRGRRQKKMVYDLLSVEPLRGLNRLPNPSDGNLYFDIEGDHFYEDGGLEYLLGVVYRDSDGKMTYNKFWAKDRKEEKKAFADFMSFVVDKWKKYPDLYIYHYAPYEPSAIKRLASRHAIFEVEVDQLLRAERFIDLYAVIRESLQASVERYSLKDLELFTDYVRQISLQEASEARRRLDAAIELNAVDRIANQDIEIVERYNEDDCRATAALHQWLEQIYQEQVSSGVEFSRPELKYGDPSETVDELDTQARQLHDALVKDLPEDPGSWNDEHHSLWLLAHQVDYFRRESRSKWWEYFRLHELDEEEALDERYAIAGLLFDKELPKQKRERNPTHRYRFPPQEVSIDEGDAVEEILRNRIGTIKSISLEDGRIDIKKTGKSIDIHPAFIHINDVIRDSTLPTSLHQFAQSIVDGGLRGNSTYQAGKHLLLKERPHIQGGDLRDPSPTNESAGDTAIRISKILDNSYLPIQGPPGTGKTHIGAQMIIELYLMDKRIGVTAVSHKVIRNLLDKVLELARERPIPIEIAQKVKEKSEKTPEGLTEYTDNKKPLEAVEDDLIVGGTTYFWARDEAVETLDYLFVDEAGQMSLANVLAASRSAKNLVLLGDPQQLEQPQKGAHPEGSDISALDHILDGNQTMPADRGLFLDTTWRLNPKICDFTSEMFYENRLKAKVGLEVQVIRGNTDYHGSGLFYVPVTHEGNQNRSIEEVEKIKQVVDYLLKSKTTWTDRYSSEHPLIGNDILIVAPYNAQVAALRQALPSMRIGTVDKFQGQEAPVVIYSMTSSSPEDAPRGMSFLYNPNRLNVATSRAQCICILVAAPKLMEPECHSIDQMRWANALCRFRELAKNIS